MTDITIDNDGTKLAASIYGPADADPILFLHGLSPHRTLVFEERVARDLRAFLSGFVARSKLAGSTFD
jgi:hypothetical protein